MVDPRVSVLVFLGGAWPALFLFVGFLAFMRQAYGAWEDQRTWETTGWVAGPLLLALLGLASSGLLLLAVPSVEEVPESLLAAVFSAVLAPIGPTLELAAVLLLATAPVALWRVWRYGALAATQTACVCVLLAAVLGAFGTHMEIHRALLSHTGSIPFDAERVAQLKLLGRATGPLVPVTALIAGLVTGGWGLVPALRHSVAELARWVTPIAAVGAAVYVITAIRIAALLP